MSRMHLFAGTLPKLAFGLRVSREELHTRTLTEHARHCGRGAKFYLGIRSAEARLKTSFSTQAFDFASKRQHSMEGKSERMHIPQWHGDPSGWREHKQDVRLHKHGENLEL